jgi:hypothetical protein
MSIVAGLSAEVVRGFLLQSAESPGWTSKYVQNTLGVDAAGAKQVLAALSMAGYIEPDGDGKDKWRNTAAGNLVAGVKAARPITRKTAEKSIADVLERARVVNADASYLYRVRKIVLFGP